MDGDVERDDVDDVVVSEFELARVLASVGVILIDGVVEKLEGVDERDARGS